MASEQQAPGPELEELSQYVQRYAPPELEIDVRLRPFLPEFVPSLGAVDDQVKVRPSRLPVPPARAAAPDAPRSWPLRAKPCSFYLPPHLPQVPRPDGEPDFLGLTVTDEPALRQSDPALLALQLWHKLRSELDGLPGAAQALGWVDPAQEPARVDSWVQAVLELHQVSQRTARSTCARAHRLSLLAAVGRWQRPHHRGQGLPSGALPASLSTLKPSLPPCAGRGQRGQRGQRAGGPGGPGARVASRRRRTDLWQCASRSQAGGLGMKVERGVVLSSVYLWRMAGTVQRFLLRFFWRQPVWHRLEPLPCYAVCLRRQGSIPATAPLPPSLQAADLRSYARLACNVVDIPAGPSCAEGLHALFASYLAFKCDPQLRRHDAFVLDGGVEEEAAAGGAMGGWAVLGQQ